MRLISNEDLGKVEYVAVIETIQREGIISMDMVGSGAIQAITGGKYLTIRHDVDHDLGKALMFATIEAANGIYATYFVRNEDAYNPDLKMPWNYVLQTIQGMGHHIGWHNDVIDAVWNEGLEDAEGYISSSLEKIRKHVVVSGTSAHGSRLCSDLGIWPHSLWAQSPPNEIDVGTILNLDTFGLDYEAYLVQRDAYLTDTGGKWNGALGKNIGFHEKMEDPLGLATTIFTWNVLKTGIFQVLIHPFWWEVK